MVSLGRVSATICMTIAVIFSMLPDSDPHPSDVSSYYGEMVSQNIPLINESLQAIGWSEDIRLTNDPGYAAYPDIAFEGNSVHVVWENYSNETGDWKYYLMYTRSTDGGLTWDDGLGNIGMTRRLVDLGEWLPLVSARMGLNGSSVHVAYMGRHGNFWWPSYMNSTDNGETWSEPRMIGSKNDSCPGALDMAVYGSNVHIVWLYGTNPLDFQVHYSMSSDGGLNWSNATKMTSEPEGTQRPSIAVDGNKVHLAYIGGVTSDENTYYRRSLDNGNTWDDGMGNIGSQRLLYHDPTNLSIASLIAASDGGIHVVWNREIPHSEWNESLGMLIYTPYYQLIYINSEDDGGNWSEPRVLVDHTDLPFNIWGDEPYGHVVGVWDVEVLGKNVSVFSSDTRDDKSTSEIYYKKSDDGGDNWTGDVRLTNATRSSFAPRAAIDDEQIHVVWVDRRDDNNPFIDSEEELYYKRYPAFSLPQEPPTNLSARLEGPALEDVNISWEAPRSEENSSLHHYDIFFSKIFDPDGSGYTILDSIEETNETTHYYLHENAGEGDPSNYFYYVCAISRTGNSSCSLDQVGKFTRPLYKGPNLVSIPLIQSDESIQTVLQTLSYNNAWSYNPINQEWKSFVKSRPYNQSLEYVNHTIGFWVNVTKDCNYTIAGIVPIQTTIHLREGWNLVSYPSFEKGYSVADLGQEVDATVRVEGFSSSNEPYRLMVMQETDALETGYGYWIMVAEDTFWLPPTD